ncbi:MAG TPA: MFS transporter [Conexibacter sp.]|nr:MFS transporter [Conexibacter sp.]
MRARSWVVTVAAGLVLADASIVTLALPELLRALDTTVEGVAAVIAVYTGVLALALLPAERVVRRLGAAHVGALGFAVFALASAFCATADTLTALLVARAIQASAGAFALVATFELIRGGTQAGRRHWLGAAVLASAVGPALGGALTQAFDWRAIFVVQIPIAAFGAVAALRDTREPATTPVVEDVHEPRTSRRADELALALVSASLTAVLFGLVLLLIAGWAIEPLAAAATVTVLPLAAIAGSRVRAAPHVRALAGCLLVGGGVLALAWLPSALVAWTFAPQALAGIGMGMALPAFAGELLPERTTREAARLLTIRHVGIALVLIALAPLIAHRLDVVTERAQEQGVALVLDAKLPPQDKLTLAPALLGGVEAERPRAGLEQALADNGRDYTGEERTNYDEMAQRADDVLVSAVGDAFRIAFLIAGGLALLGAVALAVGASRRTGPARNSSGAPAVALALVLAAGLPLVYAALHSSQEPQQVVIQDPCKDRQLPSTGGITGFLQDRALEALDTAACRYGSSREELVLALSDDQAAKRFQERYGVNPGSVGSLLQGLINP